MKFKQFNKEHTGTRKMTFYTPVKSSAEHRLLKLTYHFMESVLLNSKNGFDIKLRFRNAQNRI